MSNPPTSLLISGKKTPPLALLDMPMEILAGIQDYLVPSDIVSLRMTCKHLASSTRDRGVWANALQYICLIHGIFVPTFPIRDMTQQELEHAALTPFRFASSLTKEMQTSIKPKATRVLMPPIEDAFVQIYLVPGGRFLITLTDTAMVDLWDLGFSSTSVINTHPVASLGRDTQKGFCVDIIATAPMSDGLGFYLLLSEDDDTPSAHLPRISLYSVNPSVSSPKLIFVRSISIPNGFETVVATTGMCCIHHDEFITFWDYADDLVTTIETGDDSETIPFVSDGHILLFTIFGFTISKLPQAHTHSGTITLPITAKPIKPILYFNYPRLGDDSVVQGDFDVPEVTWPLGCSRPHIFSTMTCSIRGTMLDYYTIESLSSASSILPSFIPLVRKSVLLTEADEVQFMKLPARYCDRWLIQPWCSDSGEFMVNILDLSDPNSEEHRNVQLFQGVSESSGEDYTFCPMSGRLCCVELNGNSTEIAVMDFVIPTEHF